jgi:hypothetical protein
MGSKFTTILLSDSGFTTGMGSAVNLNGNFYGFNYSDTPTLADIRALRADWAAVGQDLTEAMEESQVETSKVQAEEFLVGHS